MTYQIYYILSIVFLSLCGAMFIASVLLFIRFRIISVIGDLSGKTAQKQIELFREGNLRTGNKKYRPSPVNLNRGKLTDSITGSGRKTGDFAKTGNTYTPSSAAGIGPHIISEVNTKNIPTDVLPDVSGKNDITEQMNAWQNATDVIEVVEDTAEKTAGLQETEVLDTPTEVLETQTESEIPTEVLGSQTEILAGGTEVLGTTVELQDEGGLKFTELKSIVIIHTDEVI